jgi:hypothetical protein
VRSGSNALKHFCVFALSGVARPSHSSWRLPQDRPRSRPPRCGRLEDNRGRGHEGGSAREDDVDSTCGRKPADLAPHRARGIHVGKDIDGAAVGTATVVVYFNDEAGRRVAHYFKRVS